ncbi:ASCH domain protein [Actinomyces sp. oral taxon 848 str. F0332]|nr:ASCH domain protein [Actinomyces sp. oral taxon 848 str. F0332]
MSRNDSEAAGRDDVDPGLPAEGSAGDAASDGGRSSDRGRSSDGGAPSDRSPSAEGSANGAVPEAETQTELEAFWTRARNVAGIAPLEAVLGQDDAASLRPPAFAFGDSPEMSDRLAKLVLDGEKSATSAWLASYEAEGIDIPEVGDLSIMCDGADRPLALLRTADVRKIPFADVGPEIARAEGEGTLDEWKAEHRDFFARECATLGIEFDPEGDVVVEFVEVLYRRDGA